MKHQTLYFGGTVILIVALMLGAIGTVRLLKTGENTSGKAGGLLGESPFGQPAALKANLAHISTSLAHDNAALNTNLTQISTRLVFAATIEAATDYIWYRESRCGKDPNWKLPKPTGEEGQYQTRPIFIEDVNRIHKLLYGSEFILDPYDLDQCRYGIALYLDYYAPKVGAKNIFEMYELYRYGYRGYRNLKGRNTGR